jgi:hypothetical protein
MVAKEFAARERCDMLSHSLMDLIVVAACCVAFAAVVAATTRHMPPKGPPVELIARDLGTTSDNLQRAINRFFPPFRHGPPTEMQRQQVADALDVPLDELDSVMESYRPRRLR